MKGTDADRNAAANVPFDAPRVVTDADLVLSVLRGWRGEWVPNLYRLTGVMVHSRIADLRKRGFQIEAKCFGRGDYRYRLLEGADKKEGA